jgi:hypothetical protein
VTSDETGWQAEAAIPMSELTGDTMTVGRAWCGNVTRVLPGRGVQAWSVPADVQPRPEGMGLVMFTQDRKEAAPAENPAVPMTNCRDGGGSCREQGDIHQSGTEKMNVPLFGPSIKRRFRNAADIQPRLQFSNEFGLAFRNLTYKIGGQPSNRQVLADVPNRFLTRS